MLVGGNIINHHELSQTIDMQEQFMLQDAEEDIVKQIKIMVKNKSPKFFERKGLGIP